MIYYKTRIWSNAVEKLFDGADHDAVADWLIANEGRRRVVMVGAGFTRNALTHSGERASPPMWPDVRRIMDEDLRLKLNCAGQSDHDALTLADFYISQLGGNALHARLRELMPDDDLYPGQVHAALAQYDAEAIVTTNFLDTVLEKAPAQVARVVMDPDLALPAPDHVRQLIYFHGHRSDFTSWVVARSHYEDLPSNRPMIYARVRQLFAQFPLLVVGYSLTDPDFHLIYREMVRCMEKRHPLGLALLTNSPDRVARTYWESLGLRIAAFKKSETPVDALLAQFFRITRSKISRLDFLKHALAPASDGESASAFHEHSKLLGSLLDDPGAAQNVEGADDPTTRYALWRDALHQALTKDRLADAHEQAKRAMRSEPSAVVIEFLVGEEDRSSSPTAAAAPFLRLAKIAEGDPHIPSRPLRPSSVLQRVLDNLIDAGVPVRELADWLSRAVADQEISEGVDNEENALLEVTVALWVSLHEHEDDRSVALDVIARCAKRAEQLEYPSAAQLTNVLRALSAQSTPGNHDALVMRDAHNELLTAASLLQNERPNEAFAVYESAYKHAEGHRDPIGAWLAAVGALDSMMLGSMPYDRAQIERWREARDRCGSYPSVARLQRRFEVSATELRKRAIERLREQVDSAGYESYSTEFNMAVGNAWKVYRLVKHRGAPPSVRSAYLKPLLVGGDQISGELDERLELDIDDTPRWLRVRLNATQKCEKSDGSTRTTLVTTVLRAPSLLVELRAKVRALPAISEFILADEVASAIDLLTRVGNENSQFSWARAWKSLCAVTEWKTVRPGLLSFLERATGQVDIALRPAALPWEHWLIADAFLDKDGNMLTEQLQRLAPSSPDVGWALASILTQGASEVTLAQARVWCERVACETKIGLNSLHPLACIVARHPQLMREGWVNRVLALCEVVASSEKAEVAEVSALISCRFIKEGVETQDVAQAFDDAIKALEEAWPRVVGHYAKTRLGAQRFAWPLAVALERNRERYAWVAEPLLHLLELSWSVLPQLSGLLSQEFWGARWPVMLSKLRFGGRDRDAKSWKLEMLDLWRRSLRARHSGRLELAGNRDLAFLHHEGLQACADDDARIANRAAYGAVQLAETVEVDNFGIEGALRCVASDSRSGVRHGAAFAAGRLPTLARAPSLRALAADLDELLKRDTTAIVLRQRSFGEASAKSRSRQ